MTDLTSTTPTPSDQPDLWAQLDDAVNDALRRCLVREKQIELVRIQGLVQALHGGTAA